MTDFCRLFISLKTSKGERWTDTKLKSHGNQFEQVLFGLSQQMVNRGELVMSKYHARKYQRGMVDV